MINTCRGEGKLTNDCRKRGSMAGDFALGSMLGCVVCCTVFRTTEKSKTEWTAMWERRIRIWRTIFTIKKLLIIFAVDKKWIFSPMRQYFFSGTFSAYSRIPFLGLCVLWPAAISSSMWYDTTRHIYHAARQRVSWNYIKTVSAETN